MENDDGRNNRASADPRLPTTTDVPSDQADSDKKKFYRRSWRSTGPIRKVGIIVLALGAAAGICYVGVAIWGVIQTKWNFETEDRPHVIFSNLNPPELTGTLSCEIVNNAVSSHIGAMNFWLKNTGSGDADAVVSNPEFRFIPKIDAAEVDSSSLVDETCKQGLTPSGMRKFRVNGGQELKVPMFESMGRQPLLGTPPLHTPITENTNFRLYAHSCVYYLDRSRERHATCRMYRLRVTGGDNADTTSFACRNLPISGTFQETPSACEN